MVRALHVVTSDARRGAETFAEALVPALERRGIEGRLLALHRSGHTAPVAAEVLGRRSYGLATLRGLRHAVRSSDVVVAHGSDSLLACALATARTGVPFVYRVIGDPSHWSAAPFPHWRVGASLRRARTVVALTEPSAEHLVRSYGVDPTRLAVIPNAVDPSRYPLRDGVTTAAARQRLALPERGKVVALVGALSPEKDPRAAIEAARRLDGVHVVVAGDGPLRASVASCPGVTMLGSVGDVGPVYAAADAVVLASRTEGVPAVAIEAALSGAPVVATDVGGTKEVVVDGVTGVLVPPADGQALTDALADVLAGRTPYDAAGARRFAIERFSLETVASDWNDLLRTIAGP